MIERVAIDIGGTFTDLIAVDTSGGEVVRAKATTRPDDLLAGVIECVEELPTGISDAYLVVHGTTAGINTLLEERGAVTALVTTAGFGDVYEIARGNHAKMYQVAHHKPAPLIPGRLRFEVDERLDASGNVLEPLDVDAVRELAQKVRGLGVESVAICLLHSYVNPDHERQVQEVFEEIDGISVSTSSQILRSWGEYERTSTTAINAYIQPEIERYMNEFGKALDERDFSGRLLVLTSNGGMVKPAIAAERPISIIESGPAGGAIGVAALHGLADDEPVVAFDMGGTTAKVCLVKDGTPVVADEYDVAGRVVRVPTVDIVEVSAGGGTIAWMDNGGAVRIGPRSAGAWPGPACYGHGGTKPTVTDANLVTGRLSAANFMGGAMPLDVAAAETAIRTEIAEPLSISVVEAAMGILKLAEVQMGAAVRAVTLDRGLDPRDLTMVAFGGGGPMHGAEIARELGIPEVVVPWSAGHFSAYGMMCAGLRDDRVRSLWRPLAGIDLAELDQTVAEMTAEAKESLLDEGANPAEIVLSTSVRMAYEGQEHALEVSYSKAKGDKLPVIFEEEHRRKFGYVAEELPVVLVAVRVIAQTPPDPPTVPRQSGNGDRSHYQEKERRTVWYGSPARPYDTPIYTREELVGGTGLPGPVLIEEIGSTTVVPPGDRVRIDEYGLLRIEIVKGEHS